MKLLPAVPGVVLLALLLAGCATTSTPASTATVTVTVPPSPAPPAPRDAEAASWDLHAVCATEAEISTLQHWRDHQLRGHRLSAREAAAVTQGIAVQYLEMKEFTTASPAQEQIDALARAAGTLDDPEIDPTSAAVRTARAQVADACRDGGLTIGVSSQGG
jgi:cell division septation protein DedD